MCRERRHRSRMSGVWLALVAALAAELAQAAPAALPDFVALVEANAPTVVNISTSQVSRAGAEEPGPEGSEQGPFNEWLKRHYGENLPPEPLDGKSLGSGFLISDDGYILTCAHVVEGAQEIVVRLSDRREYTAEVVGRDRKTDVALLRIAATRLPKVRVGQPGRLKVGEWVLAIGSPFGFDSSATTGIVSAKGRNLPRESYVPFIQTDAAINPGNSGGPLFNLRGEVVGINAQIYSRTGGFMGVSFAVPIDIAMEVARQLKEHGRVRRGWLGVKIQDVNRDLADGFGLSHPQGALVSEILPNSPADAAGLRAGDIIVEFDGRPVRIGADLAPVVGQTPPGRKARMTVMREGQAQVIALVVTELPEVADTAPVARVGGVTSDPLGLVLSEPGAEQRQRLGLSHGIVVEKVGEGQAARAGLRAGDIIVEVGGSPVKGVVDFRRQISALPAGKALALRVRRGPGMLYVALRRPE